MKLFNTIRIFTLILLIGIVTYLLIVDYTPYGLVILTYLLLKLIALVLIRLTNKTKNGNVKATLKQVCYDLRLN